MTRFLLLVAVMLFLAGCAVSGSLQLGPGAAPDSDGPLQPVLPIYY